jgi:hypothetical protein
LPWDPATYIPDVVHAVKRAKENGSKKCKISLRENISFSWLNPYAIH